MKTILCVRHAKSSWDDISISDSERKLTHRGKKDSKRIAERLRERSVDIDAFVSSTAKRAMKTAKLFMKVYDKDKKKLMLDPALYEASVRDFYDVIESLKDKYDTVALFSHNPGITDFVNSLDCAPVYEMPTCAVFAVKVKTTHWKYFRAAKKEFLFFDYPKNKQS